MALLLTYSLPFALLAALLVARWRIGRAYPRPGGWPALAREACLFVAAYVVYFCVRGLAKDRIADALRHARTVLGFEHRVGFAWEASVQRAVLRAELLIDIANWVYIWAFWPLLAGTLVWLFQRHPDAYPLYRNAILLSGAMGLVVFLTYPVAPPRFLDNGQFVDTVGNRSLSYQLLLPHSLANLYAAMPSLHAGWVLLVGVAIARHARRWPWRLAGALLPVAMFLSIVGTANHYILDGLAGWCCALLALALAQALGHERGRPPRRWTTTMPTMQP
jgi:hypothetical protein